MTEYYGMYAHASDAFQLLLLKDLSRTIKAEKSDASILISGGQYGQRD